mmetsp:Transcript_3014/g.5210  ORF Transcript_3014/g.5210 Transcript_3014/m.5210 type:complete len:100 (+) Transcript_3014:382-681(+)
MSIDHETQLARVCFEASEQVAMARTQAPKLSSDLVITRFGRETAQWSARHPVAHDGITRIDSGRPTLSSCFAGIVFCLRRLTESISCSSSLRLDRDSLL